MKSRDASNEVQTASVLEDFEEGDKVFFFRKSASSSITGFVTKVEEDGIWVTINRHEREPFKVGNKHLSDDDPAYIGQWRKIPDDTWIEVGDIMSTTLPRYVGVAGTREFFTVLEIIPGQHISLRSHVDPDYIARIDGSHSIDEYLKYWDMEG